MSSSFSRERPVVAFVDLDDSLFRSERKAWLEPGAPDPHSSPEAERSAWLGRAATVNPRGEPHSYMSPAAERLFAWLLDTCEQIVPTTARTRDAFERVRLPFEGPAIVALGALMLDAAGRADPAWAKEAQRRRQSDLQGRTWGEVSAALARACPRLDHREVKEDGQTVYLSIRHDETAQIEADAPRLAAVAERLCGQGLVVSAHTRDILVRPRSLGKAEAVRWFRTHRIAKPSLTLGLGDRDDDAEFMAACDFALTPSNSQLMARWTA